MTTIVLVDATTSLMRAGTVVSSTAGGLLPANWIQYVKVTPGQRVSAISNDAGTLSLGITEFTK